MPKRPEPGYRRAASLAAALLLTAPMMAACSALAPTKEEMQTEDNAAKYAQTMRMAANVRSGGDPAAAASFYQRAHALDPKQAEPLIGLAEAAAAAGARDQAIEYLRQAITLAPGNVAARRSYGTLLLSGGAAEQALETFRGAVEKDPQDHRSFNGMGVALDLLGRQTEAQQVYRQGLKVAPVSSSLRNNLALSLAIAGDREQALEMLQKLAAEPSAGPRIRQNLALVYALDNDLQQAVAIASRDLSQAELRNNISLYRALPTMSAPEMASAVFGIGRKPGAAVHSAVATEIKTASIDETNPLVRQAQAVSAGGGAPSGVRQDASSRTATPSAPGASPGAAMAAPVPLVATHAADLGGMTAEQIPAPAAGDEATAAAAATPSPRRSSVARKNDPSAADLAPPPVHSDAAGPIVSFAGSEQSSDSGPDPYAAAGSGATVAKTATSGTPADSGRATNAPPSASSPTASASGDASGLILPVAVTMPERPVVQPEFPSSATPPALTTSAAASVEAPPPAAMPAGPRTSATGLQTNVSSPGGSAVIRGLGLSLIEPVVNGSSGAKPSSALGADAGAASVSQQPAPTRESTDPLLTPEPIGRQGL
jgi:Flp pilus assembly protein TadD